MTKDLQRILRIGELKRLRAEIKEEPKRFPITNWKEYLYSGEVVKKKLTNLFKGDCP